MKTLYRYREGDVSTGWIPATSSLNAWREGIDRGLISRSVTPNGFRSHLERGGAYFDTDDFDDEYIIEFNPVVRNSAWEGRFFETYGPEEQYIIALGEERVWTILDADDLLWIVAGFRRIDRIGYLVTTAPWKDREETYIVS